MMKRIWLLVFCLVIGVLGFGRNSENLLSKNADRHCILGLSFAANYQRYNFVNTDFTGTNLFVYENKIRYSGKADIQYDFSEKYFLVGGIRLQDAGWKRSDSLNVIEVHRDHSSLYFLYLSPSVGIGRRIYQRTNFDLNLSIGVDPEFKVCQREKIYFSDNTMAKSEPSVETVKYNTLFWFSLKASLAMGQTFSIGAFYTGGINSKSFNKTIIQNNPFLQSFGLTLGIKLK
jgi:hypothetical protein